MTNSQEALNWLRDRVKQLDALLSDAEPGMLTWVEAYNNIMVELNEFWRGGWSAVKNKEY